MLQVARAGEDGTSVLQAPFSRGHDRRLGIYTRSGHSKEAFFQGSMERASHHMLPHA